MLILNESEIRELAYAENARSVIEGSFRALHRGDATLPGVISMHFERPSAIAHVKAGHLHDQSVWTLKVSSDIEPDDGGPTRHNGLMLVIDTGTGALAGVLLDNGYLTDLRTGAAGALAADALARQDASTAALVGAGNQARFQLEALLQVRSIDTVHVTSRSPERAEELAGEIEARWGLAARAFRAAEDAVREADIVITVTPSTTPLVRAEWLRPGVHVTAVGSDEPTKQELETEVLRRADVIGVDDRDQAARFGELHHALEAGVADEGKVATLGELLAGEAAGRTRPEDVTVADLTGVGTQDAAIAGFVFAQATAAGAAPRSGRD